MLTFLLTSKAFVRLFNQLVANFFRRLSLEIHTEYFVLNWLNRVLRKCWKKFVFQTFFTICPRSSEHIYICASKSPSHKTHRKWDYNLVKDIKTSPLITPRNSIQRILANCVLPYGKFILESENECAYNGLKL